MGADGALNRTHLDRSLDKAPIAPATPDAVEASLARALDGATAAGRWDVVSQLARELEARRLAAAGNVVVLDAETRWRRA